MTAISDTLTKVSYSKVSCQGCKAELVAIKCAACFTLYCSPECQKADLPSHLKLCAPKDKDDKKGDDRSETNPYTLVEKIYSQFRAKYPDKTQKEIKDLVQRQIRMNEQVLIQKIHGDTSMQYLRLAQL